MMDGMTSFQEASEGRVIEQLVSPSPSNSTNVIENISSTSGGFTSMLPCDNDGNCSSTSRTNATLDIKLEDYKCSPQAVKQRSDVFVVSSDVGILSLPDEMLYHVFQMLPKEDVYFSISQVCSRFRNVVATFMISDTLEFCYRKELEIYLKPAFKMLKQLRTLNCCKNTFCTDVFLILSRYCHEIENLYLEFNNDEDENCIPTYYLAALSCRFPRRYLAAFGKFLKNSKQLMRLHIAALTDNAIIRLLAREVSHTLKFLNINASITLFLCEISKFVNLTTLALELKYGIYDLVYDYDFKNLLPLRDLLNFKFHYRGDCARDREIGFSQTSTYRSMDYLFSSKTFANIQVLSLNFVGILIDTELRSLMKHFHKLQYLELLGVEITENTLSQILNANIHLHYIYANICHNSKFYGLQNILCSNAFATHMSLEVIRNYSHDESILALTKLCKSLTVKITQKRSFAHMTYFIENGMITGKETEHWSRGRQLVADFFQMH